MVLGDIRRDLGESQIRTAVYRGLAGQLLDIEENGCAPGQGLGAVFVIDDDDAFRAERIGEVLDQEVGGLDRGIGRQAVDDNNACGGCLRAWKVVDDDDSLSAFSQAW